MAKIIKEGKHTYWVNGEGLKVPAKLVHEEDKLRDKVVSSLVAKAKQLQIIIKQQKELMEAELLRFLGEAAKREDEEWVGGTTIADYSGTQQATIKVAKRWTFDERLQIAKTKIDKCIELWSGNANSKLLALVNRAFKVDNKGDVDAKQIMGLRTLKIDDELWMEAMELIADSQKVQGTKTYFYFQEADEAGKMQTIVLDFSAL
jgi:hypothetical protein